MATRYVIAVFHKNRDSWVDELEQAIVDEVAALGIHRSVEVIVTSADTLNATAPTVGVYFGSLASATDSGLRDRIALAISLAIPIIPVVDSLKDFAAVVPSILAPLNGWERSGSNPGRRLARRLLEELGVEDRRRRVFISHKREDGLAAAEQLFDFLSHRGFEPYVDRFGVGMGQDVQNEIADALEDCAFLLLIETPLAHMSEWVFDEVEYAETHQMGMHIVSWPGDPPEIPATNRFPRQRLRATDLRRDKGYDVFADPTLEDILEEVEAIHANAIARRRRYLLRSAEDAAAAVGLTCTPLEGWRLLVEGPGGPSVVQVSARLPTVDDLHDLDKVRTGLAAVECPGVLVHSARALRRGRMEVLTWAAGARDLTLIPENAVGGYWR